MKRSTQAALVAAAAALGSVAAPAVAGATVAPAPTYYLSLGDSLSQGYQPVGGTTHIGINTDQGYVDDIYQAQLANASTNPADATLQLVKLGCPGETTTTYLRGGICPNYHSQNLAAVNFLKHHGAQTKFITLDIGANNVDSCLTFDPTTGLANGVNGTCFINGTKTAAKQLAVILTNIKAAAPNVPIYGMTYYDPFLALYLQGEVYNLQNGIPEGTPTSPGTIEENLAEGSVGLSANFNGALDQVYSAFGVPVTDVGSATALAGAPDAFNTTDQTSAENAQIPVAPGVSVPVPDNVANICALTWECNLSNIHPNQNGYQVIAGDFQALGGALTS